MTDYAAILSCYSLLELIELNDMTEEEILQTLVEEDILKLPDIKPIDFDD